MENCINTYAGLSENRVFWTGHRQWAHKLSLLRCLIRKTICTLWPLPVALRQSGLDERLLQVALSRREYRIANHLRQSSGIIGFTASSAGSGVYAEDLGELFW